MIGSDNCVDPCRFPHGPNPLSLMERERVTFTSEIPQRSGRKNIRGRCLRSEHPIGVLSKREFQARFRISDIIPIQLTDGEVLSSADLSILSLFKQYLHFTQIPLAFLHLNIVWILMGCNVLDMLFQQDFSLLEFLFIYTVKMNQKDKFSLFAHIPSLQLVTSLPDSCKGWVKGHVLVSSPWNGSSKGPDGVFSPQRSLEILSRLYFFYFLSVLLLFSPCCESTHNLYVRLIHVRKG